MRQLELADVVAPLRLKRGNNVQAVRAGQSRQHCQQVIACERISLNFFCM
ncbi:hypothetical protein [Undibacterium sp.]|nr:hypothetical protein [Undibacterium sp.]MDP1978305.1 hypothetical protein [Undibacterium sp.]